MRTDEMACWQWFYVVLLFLKLVMNQSGFMAFICNGIEVQEEGAAIVLCKNVLNESG